VLTVKDLKQITVIGLGLLGGSVTLTAKSRLNGLKVAGYSHRDSTRQKAREKALADRVFDDIGESVAESELVILATPIFTFKDIFEKIAGSLKAGTIVTDVGSTKVLPEKWAKQSLPENVTYIGSHPIAGSEQRGLEYARDDLFENALCIVTADREHQQQSKLLEKFWSKLGCNVYELSPAEHDRVFANVSHLPHIIAAALINANTVSDLKWAGKGFIDTSRIASGPANIWSDILSANRENAIEGIKKTEKQLELLKNALEEDDKDKLEELLNKARSKRNTIIEDTIKNKGIVQ
jgi:prephenate dehydrogenase